jgi:hypothetical protein
MSELSSLLNSVLNIRRPVAVKGAGLDGGLRPLSRLPLGGFCGSDSTRASSSWGLVAAKSSRGLFLVLEEEIKFRRPVLPDLFRCAYEAQTHRTYLDLTGPAIWLLSVSRNFSCASLSFGTFSGCEPSTCCQSSSSEDIILRSLQYRQGSATVVFVASRRCLNHFCERSRPAVGLSI